MHIFLIAAISIDGQIGQASDQVSTAWTSKEDKQFFVQRTKQAGVMVLGSQTFRTFNRLLLGRSMIVQTRNVEAFRQSVTFEVIEVTSETQELSRDDVLYVSSLSVKELAELLSSLGKEELAICGGSSVYTQWVDADLVETLYLTIEPVVFGKGVQLFSTPLHKKYQLQEAKQLSSQTLLLSYTSQEE